MFCVKCLQGYHIGECGETDPAAEASGSCSYSVDPAKAEQVYIYFILVSLVIYKHRVIRNYSEYQQSDSFGSNYNYETSHWNTEIYLFHIVIFVT